MTIEKLLERCKLLCDLTKGNAYCVCLQAMPVAIMGPGLLRRLLSCPFDR